jgi:hypothetical protein
MKQTETLTPEQDRALRAFAALHGRTWKAALRGAWMRGTDVGELRQVRNTFGPAWLTNFRLETKAQALAKFVTQVEGNYAVSSVVGRITGRAAQCYRCTTCDSRVIETMQGYAHGLGLGLTAEPQGDSYLITIR